MNTNPLVSVIIPVFNTEKYVAEAIESILRQTYEPIEIVCINNGSTDGSLEILKSFGDRIVLIDSKENLGISGGRNKGIEIAQGEFLAFLDADDLSEPERIEVQVRHLQEHPELAISFSWMSCFISPELSDELKQIRYCPPNPMPGCIPGTALVRTEAFKQVGYFNPKWRLGEFIDWLARAKDLGLASDMLPDVFLLRRIHETNTGVTERPSRIDYVKVIREALERRKLK